MPVPTKRSVHSIHESPAGNIPDRSYRSLYDPPNVRTVPSPAELFLVLVLLGALVRRRSVPMGSGGDKATDHLQVGGDVGA